MPDKKQFDRNPTIRVGGIHGEKACIRSVCARHFAHRGREPHRVLRRPWLALRSEEGSHKGVYRHPAVGARPLAYGGSESLHEGDLQRLLGKKYQKGPARFLPLSIRACTSSGGYLEAVPEEKDKAVEFGILVRRNSAVRRFEFDAVPCLTCRSTIPTYRRTPPRSRRSRPKDCLRRPWGRR